MLHCRSWLFFESKSWKVAAIEKEWYGTKYSRVDQVKCFKRCLPQILLGPTLNTWTHIFSILNVSKVMLLWWSVQSKLPHLNLTKSPHKTIIAVINQKTYWYFQWKFLRQSTIFCHSLLFGIFQFLEKIYGVWNKKYTLFFVSKTPSTLTLKTWEIVLE